MITRDPHFYKDRGPATFLALKGGRVQNQNKIKNSHIFFIFLDEGGTGPQHPLLNLTE